LAKQGPEFRGRLGYSLASLPEEQGPGPTIIETYIFRSLHLRAVKELGIMPKKQVKEKEKTTVQGFCVAGLGLTILGLTVSRDICLNC
jgi:hypothetical protein